MIVQTKVSPKIFVVRRSLASCEQDEEPMAFNDEEELKRKQAAERAAAQQERLRDAYVFFPMKN